MLNSIGRRGRSEIWVLCWTALMGAINWLLDLQTIAEVREVATLLMRKGSLYVPHFPPFSFLISPQISTVLPTDA